MLLDNNTDIYEQLKPKKVPKIEIISVPVDNSNRSEFAHSPPNGM